MEFASPFFLPYSVAADNNGEAWAVSEFTHLSCALIRTPASTNYLMPRETNMRRAFVDNSGAQVKFWVGNTHQASILRVQPLDGPVVASAMK